MGEGDLDNVIGVILTKLLTANIALFAWEPHKQTYKVKIKLLQTLHEWTIMYDIYTYCIYIYIYIELF